MKFRMSRIPKHQTFGYTPRFYDPDKERREMLMADYQNAEDPDEHLKRRISSGFATKGGSQFSFRTERNKQATASNRRLFLIIGVMLLLGYYLLQSNVAGIVGTVTGN